MDKIPRRRALKIVVQGTKNLLSHRPLTISLEITHSCTGNCNHCDKGGIIENEKRASPERFIQICRELKPIAIQVSGGEPLLREDVYDIVRGIRALGDLPYIIFVTNASLLSLEKYLKLKEAGVDHFSISLDYPDERHDDNRHIPGLFAHLSGLVPKIAALDNHDITLETVIRRDNLRDLPLLVKRALEWGVKINLSVYTSLRTGNPDHLLHSEQDLQEFRDIIYWLVQCQRRTRCIMTTPKVLWRYYRFFADRGFPDCHAGIRFVTVNPDGRFVPCAMYPHRSFDTLEELLRNFQERTLCDGCYISSRANSEKSAWEFLIEGLQAIK